MMVLGLIAIFFAVFATVVSTCTAISSGSIGAKVLMAFCWSWLVMIVVYYCLTGLQ